MMKISKTIKKLILGVSVLTPGMLYADVVLHEWNFQSGTDLADTYNAGVDAGNVGGVVGGGPDNNFGEIRPDGTLRLSGDDGTAKWVNLASNYDVNSHSGIFSFKLEVAAWDLSDFEGEIRNFATALQSESNGNFPRFIIATTETAGVNMTIQTNNVGEGGITTAGITDLPLVNTDTSYTFEAILDFNTGEVHHFFEDVLLGTYEGVTDTEINRLGFTRWGGAFDQAGAWIDYNSMSLTALDEVPASRVAQISPGELDFGNVEVEDSHSLEFTISNTGNATLTVNDITLPDGYSADWTSGSVEAGADQVVTVTFSPMEEGNYDGIITFVSDATSGDDSIAVSGSAVEATVPLPDIDFGDTISLGQDWFNSSWLGIYNDTHMVDGSTGWIYHADLGWWWLQADAAGAGETMYAFSPDLEWNYFDIDLFPYFFSYDDGWVFYDQESDGLVILEEDEE